ncbi:MAG: alanine--tRNA ligase [Proteobacteria bacterium]|nr:alanine--tRNA ligase [Pseudomonadota bacterium]
MSTKPEFKIIADHLRSSSFLIADGILPSNEGRGYVLRRIMRRAMLQLHKLGARETSMYKLVDVLIKEMGTAFPELKRAREVIIETLKNEEERFRETLENGFEIIDKELAKQDLIWTGDYKFSGKTAFKLYDTYGFPLDLTQIILQAKGIKNGVDVAEFDREMEAQRERARKNWSGSGETAEEKIFFDLKEKFGETKFLGYETLQAKAKILAIEEIFGGKQKIIILDQTPFYATSGGQKGDDGKIISGGSEIEIFETKKFAGNLFVHLVAKISGNFVVGDEIIAEVNSKTRAARAANHSATHLMHKALKLVLGNSISQKGSNVDVESFTFDFNFNRAMSVEEIAKVENLVNGWIAKKSAVNTNLMDLEKARESGAEALFGEKYDTQVRVVSMGESIELCGGTHVKNTAEIEIFKIIAEKSVASGIRRIEAKTGEAVKKYLSEQEEKLKKFALELCEKIKAKNQEIINLSGVKPDNSYTQESDSKILEEILKKKDKEIEQLKKQKLFANLNNLKAEKIGDLTLVSHIFADAEAKDIRDIATDAKAKKEFQASTIFIFFGYKDEKVAVCIALSTDLVEKFDAAKLIAPVIEKIGGKGGGGKKDLAMGGGVDKEAIESAIEVLRQILTK